MAQSQSQKKKGNNKHASNLRRKGRKYPPCPKDPITGRKIRYRDWKQKASQGACGSSFCNCNNWR